MVAGGGGSESKVSGKATSGGMDTMAGSYSAWQLAGGYSGVRGWLVSVIRVAGWTEAVSQRRQWLLQLPARWTLAQGASNVGR